MGLCRYDTDRECVKECTRIEGCVKCILEEAEEMYPYKVVGKPETYSDYNQGWCDALAFVDARMHF